MFLITERELSMSFVKQYNPEWDELYETVYGGDQSGQRPRCLFLSRSFYSLSETYDFFTGYNAWIMLMIDQV